MVSDWQRFIDLSAATLREPLDPGTALERGPVALGAYGGPLAIDYDAEWVDDARKEAMLVGPEAVSAPLSEGGRRGSG